MNRHQLRSIRKALLGLILLSFFTVGMLPAVVHATPAVTSPPPGTTLPGETATFVWTAGGTANIIEWWLYIGTSQGTNDIYDSGRIVGAGSTTDTVSGLPVDGSTIHVRLWWKVQGGGWSSTDHIYTAATSELGGLRLSAVNGTVQTIVRTNKGFPNNPTFISLPVTTTTDGIFLISFTSRSAPGLCIEGQAGNCDDIFITQTVYFDGQRMPPEILTPRIFNVDGIIEHTGTYQYSAHDIKAGEHLIEVKVSCETRTLQAKTCETEGYEAVVVIDSLSAIHPK